MKKRLRKKYQQQAQQREEAAKQTPQDRPVDAGWDFFQAGRYREAVAAWKNALPEEQQALRPVLAETYFRLAMEQHAASKDQAALTFLQQAVNLAPSQWLYHYHLALTWHRLGNLSRAATCYRQALAGQPGNQRVLLHLGFLMVQQELASPGSALAAWLAGPEGQSLPAARREFLASLVAILRGQLPPPPVRHHQRDENRGTGAADLDLELASASSYEIPPPTSRRSPLISGSAREDNLLSDEPMGSSAAFLTGIIYAKKEEWAAAKSWLEQAVHWAPDHPAYWLAWGEAQAVTGDLHSGEESFARAGALGAGEPAQAWLIAVQQTQVTQAAAAGDLTTVIRLLEARDNPPGPLLACAYFARGNHEARNEQWAEAKADWERAVSCGPAASDLPDIMHNLALMAEREGQHQEAVRYWRQTISGWSELLNQGEDQGSLRRYLALAYRHLADLLLADGNLSEAAVDLELALQYDSEDLEARLTLANTQGAMEEPQKAIRTLLPVVQQQPGNVEAVGMLASLYTEIENYDAAKDVLQKGLAVEPQEPVLTGMLTSIGNRLALQYMAQGELIQANREIQESLRISPQDPEALSLTGVMAYWIGKEKEGENWFQEILRLAPRDPRSHLIVGRAYFMAGHPRKAATQLKAAMDLAGNAPQVCYQAAEIYLAAQKEKQAEAALLRALDYPGISREEVFLGAVDLCCDREACEVARRLLRRAIQEFPQSVELRLRYVQCLAEASEEEALDQLAAAEMAINATGTPEEKQEWRKLRTRWQQVIEDLVEGWLR